MILKQLKKIRGLYYFLHGWPYSKRLSLGSHFKLKTTHRKNIAFNGAIRFGSNLKIHIFENGLLKIGHNVYVGDSARIFSLNSIIIGNNVVISDNVFISDNYHPFQVDTNLSVMDVPLKSKGNTIIGDNAFIGYGAVILSGVKVGKFATIGSNSVVTADVPEYAVVGGVPAKEIKKNAHE